MNILPASGISAQQGLNNLQSSEIHSNPPNCSVVTSQTTAAPQTTMVPQSFSDVTNESNVGNIPLNTDVCNGDSDSAAISKIIDSLKYTEVLDVMQNGM